MKFLLIMIACKYDTMTHEAMKSVIDSDYDGDIVLVTPDHINIPNIDVVNTPSMMPPDSMMAAGILSTRKAYDYVVWIHNDVILPKFWFRKAIDAINSTDGHVWVLSLPFCILHGEPTSYNYDDILNCISSDDIHTPYIVESSDKIGPGVWNARYDKDRATIFGSACIINYNYIYDMISQYGKDTYWLCEYILLDRGIREKKWSLTLNCDVVVHYISHDTHTYRLGEYANNKWCIQAYKMWFNIFGYNIEHLIDIWSSYIMARNRHIINRSVNTGEWDNINYLFNEAIELQGRKDCNNCPVVLCAGDNNIGCLYQGCVNKIAVI